MALLDIHPIGEGDALVIPRRHVESFTELSADEASRLAKLGKTVAQVLKRSIAGSEGISLSQADGLGAGVICVIT